MPKNPTANPSQPGQNRKQNNKPQTPKVMLKAYSSVSTGANNTFILFVEASAFLSGQPMSGKEVTLKEGIKTLDAQNLDVNGEVLLKATGSLENVEQVKTLRVCLTGMPEEKNLTVTIPAIKKIVHRKKNIAITSSCTVDANTNTAEVIISCLVSEDGAICANQQVALIRKATQIDQKASDANGRATFQTTEPLPKAETTILFRVILPGLTDEVEVNVTLPAAEPKKPADDDPDSLALYSFHDGKGNFNVMTRVLTIKDKGIATKVSFFFKGKKEPKDTDGSGEAIFDIPGRIAPGKEYELSAFVSGVAKRARLTLKNRRHKPSFRKKKNWLVTTNNGRALLLYAGLIVFWLIIMFWGLAKSPVLNSDIFRDKKTGLSSVEARYNDAARIVGKEYVITPKDVRRPIPGTLIVIGILLTIFAVPYSILAWREEIMDGIGDGFERIVSDNHDRVNDPKVEQWLKYYGMMHVVRNPKPASISVSTPPPAASNTGSDTNQGTEKEEEHHGHPSLWTLFQLDFLSDTLTRILPAIGKKLFGKY